MEIEKYISEFKLKDYKNFKEFYNLTSKPIYFTALGILKERSMAEDIMQDTYKSFLENIDSYEQNTNIFGYLTVIARNKSYNMYNKNKRTVSGDDIFYDIGEEAVYDDGGVEEILSHLKDAVDREIVVYHVLLDYKFSEIAHIMKKPLGTVLWKYNRAMKKLREEVERQ